MYDCWTNLRRNLACWQLTFYIFNKCTDSSFDQQSKVDPKAAIFRIQFEQPKYNWTGENLKESYDCISKWTFADAKFNLNDWVMFNYFKWNYCFHNRYLIAIELLCLDIWISWMSFVRNEPNAIISVAITRINQCWYNAFLQKLRAYW